MVKNYGISRYVAEKNLELVLLVDWYGFFCLFLPKKSLVDVLTSGLLSSEFQRNCDKIIKFIARKGGRVDRQQLLSSRQITVVKGDDNAKAYDSVLEYLIESGRIGIIEARVKKDYIYFLLEKTQSEGERV